MLQYTNYHRGLRTTAVIFALILIFESGLLSDSTATLADKTESYLANAIGMTATVEPTEINQITAALTEQKQQLDIREANLKEREIAVGISTDTNPRSSDSTTYVLAAILFILLVLIILNYTLDYLRYKEQENLQTV